MAVYTKLADSELQDFAHRFSLGDLIATQGIAEGSINSIYKLTTSSGVYFLRVLEERGEQDIQFEASLLTFLHDANIPVPRMCRVDDGKSLYISLNATQHVSVFECVPGTHRTPDEITMSDAEQIGTFLGHMQLALARFTPRRSNPFTPACTRSMLQRCRDAGADLTPLAAIVPTLNESSWDAMGPVGIVHGDLFPNNAHFLDGKLIGVLDFEFSGTAPLLYDVAVTMFAWGLRKKTLDLPVSFHLAKCCERATATPLDAQRLYDLLLYVAARYTVSRFHDFELPRAEAKRAYLNYREPLCAFHVLRDLGATGIRDGLRG